MIIFLIFIALGYLIGGVCADTQEKLDWPPVVAGIVEHDALQSINASRIEADVAYLSAMRTRHFNNLGGKDASAWVVQTVKSIFEKAPSTSPWITKVTHVKHKWRQSSVIVDLIPNTAATPLDTTNHNDGNLAKRSRRKKKKAVVLSAHLDSTNYFFPGLLWAPGADDDASGVATLLEVLRVLLHSDSNSLIGAETDTDDAAGTVASSYTIPNRPVQLHFYAAEEQGLRGSKSILKTKGAHIYAQLHQDMTGFNPGGSGASPPQFSLIRDNTNKELNDFVAALIVKYVDPKSVIERNDRCGYGCSDHTSAFKNGVKVSYLFEAPIAKANPFTHTILDTLDRLDIEKMKMHTIVALAFVVELTYGP